MSIAISLVSFQLAMAVVDDPPPADPPEVEMAFRGLHGYIGSHAGA